MSTSSPSSSATFARALPGARGALLVLLLINLFNYIDRQVLAAVVPRIKETFFWFAKWRSTGGPARMVSTPSGFQTGKRPRRPALDGVHGVLHDRRTGLRPARWWRA